MTMPVQPEGTRSEVSFTSAAFSPKMARSRRSSGASSVSDLRRDLADEDVAGFHFGADADDAVVPRFLRASSPTLGMSRVISSGPSLVSRALTSNSSMWIEV
jgi:hypothetical protein